MRKKKKKKTTEHRRAKRAIQTGTFLDFFLAEIQIYIYQYMNK